MKRREFFKMALAPLAAAVGLSKPGILPAMSTDMAPGFVNEYFPAPPDAALAMDGDFCCMMWTRIAPGERREVDGLRVEVSPDTTQDVHIGLPECNAPVLFLHEKPLAEWDGRAEE